MKICILDKNIPKEVKANLKKEDFKLIFTEEIKNLKSPLSTHADMQVCRINDKKIVVEPSVFDYYFNKLNDYDIIVEKGSGFLREKYPEDSLYNLAANEDIAIHNFKIADENVLKNLKKQKINVKQGYSKCNICFAKDIIITSDYGIYKKIPQSVKKLLVESGDIELQGYDYGFIGGATGFFKKLYFIGNLEKYKEKEKIKEFLKNNDIEYKSLCEGSLKDFGSLIFLEGRKNARNN